MPEERKTKQNSDFERFQEERRRYASAKREARLLKGGLPQGDDDQLADHPWALASMKAKTAGETSTFSSTQLHSAKARKWRLGLSGFALVCLLGLTYYSAVPRLTESGSSSPIPAPTISTVVWHNVSENEADLLRAFTHEFHALASENQADETQAGASIRIHFVSDIPLSLRVTPLIDRPSMIVTDLATATVLASTGYLQPLFPLTDQLSEHVSQHDQYWLPLSPESTWVRPIVAVVPKVQPPGVTDHGIGLAYYLFEQVRSH